MESPSPFFRQNVKKPAKYLWKTNLESFRPIQYTEFQNDRTSSKQCSCGRYQQIEKIILEELKNGKLIITAH